MQHSAFLQYINQDEMTKIVCDLVKLNTVNPPGNEYLCRPIVEEKMRSLGMEVSCYEKEPGRTNIIGKIGNGSPSLAFVSHMDTVPAGERDLWATDPFQPVVKDGKIYGRGTLDDKGSFAACYFACKAFLAEHPDFGGSLSLIAAADEELGSKLGVGYLIEEVGLKFDACIIPDGGENTVAVYGEKGIVWIEVTSFGKQAHASLPSFGKNAIVPLAELITELKTLTFEQNYNKEFDGWTMNIGKVEGGSAANIVPARAKAVIDFRIPEGITKEDVIQKIEEKVASVKGRDPDAHFEIKLLHATVPHIINREAKIVQSFDTAAKNLNIPMQYETMGGNTVAKEFYLHGTDAIVHYPGDHHLAHVPNEYVVIDDLVQSVVLYAETLKEYFGLSAGVKKIKEAVSAGVL